MAAAGNSERPQLTKGHRVLIGVVVTGAVIIAAIGFAGSYAAVRELAVDKGFGDFAYVFPIGIDAGICVLLALDLLLTWIRIPFPLLRQTAWLLTAATIAFNGAAAWPDPLGVGMHAIIPVLFVVAVEAARHAIGRIADITADKHMEGVRLTRWLLSPVPTFFLWRRMKLWELRSYDQVIKLEQERLVYRARLRSRFGRAWRRKAPVESLMPLRLARYGVPLAETVQAGLAAAGIQEPSHRFTVERAPVPVQGRSPELQLAEGHGRTAFEEGRGRPLTTTEEPDEQPTATTANRSAPPAPSDPRTDIPGVLSVVDRYYLAWMEYQAQHGGEPGADQFSAFLATKGMFGRGGRPVSPSTLRRYPLQFRTYNVWAEHRMRTEAPAADAVAHDCAARGLTAQYNKPIVPAQIAEQADDFERRWQVLTEHLTEAHQ